LKATLRHRPEILIIGEIRDAKTARAAVDAALSGHLVFSTLHASCAGSALKRLQAWKLSPTDLLASIRLINYQRLLPTSDFAFKILCEQLQPTLNWFTDLKNIQISSEWRKQLEDCQAKKWITFQTKKLFWQG
jgi:competence protein ComGA